MPAGTVDYDNLYANYVKGSKGTRIRTLRNLKTRVMVQIFGYAAHAGTTGPWFGWPIADIAKAPCNHCGRVGVFTSINHMCPGEWDGVKLPCGGGHRCHRCEGEPSMSHHGVSQWLVTEWEEV